MPQRKTARSWFGPYTIERVKNRLLVKLENVEKLVRVSRLKLYHERLRRKASHLRKKLERGMRVKILWGGDNKVYRGTLGRFSKRQGTWKVHYDDGRDIYELEEHIAQEGESFQD